MGFSWAADSCSASFPTKYDSAIKSAVKTYWADLPAWKLLKAQYWQESHLDPAAASGAGARGIAQFTGPAWDDTLRQMGLSGDRSSIELSINAGAFYMARLRRQWAKERSGMERHDLALPSYNAGIGNVLKAQALCNNAHLWPDIAPCMVKATGPENAKQTTDYVVKIHRWWQEMELQ